jgi:phage/plasmid primase-like uncharacterized protein
MSTKQRQRSGQHPPGWHEGRYDAKHKAERARRIQIKHTLRCPRCHRSCSSTPDRLLHLDHCDDCNGQGCRSCNFTGYLDGLSCQPCNARAAAINTNRKRRAQPYTRARARARVLSTRAAGSTEPW